MKIFFRTVLGVLLLTVVFNISQIAYGAAGDLDLSFGGDGWVSTQAPGSNGSLATSVVVQPDQRIVVGGMSALVGQGLDFCLTRYLPDGSLDPSFGAGGIVLTDFPGMPGQLPADYIHDILLQPDGKIIAGGGTVLGTNLPISQAPPSAGDVNFALARYLPDGSLDAGFGNGGLVVLDFSGVNNMDGVNGLALQPDGKIVAAGYVAIARGSSNDDFAVARFNGDGSLDMSFGNAGQVRINFSAGSDDMAHRVSLQSDGKILIAGSSQAAVIRGGRDFALARLNSDGSFDGTFGNAGLITTNFVQSSIVVGQESEDVAYGLMIQPDGRILTVGSAIEQNFNSGRIALARYLSNGSLDSSFGDQGKVLTDFSNQIPGALAEGRDLALTTDGKIVVGGNIGVLSNSPLNTDFILTRYLSDGRLDPSFGQGGTVTANFPGQSRGLDGANEIALQANGKVVAVGYVQIGLIGDSNELAFGLARFEGDPREETPPPPAPAVENPTEPRPVVPQGATAGIQLVIEGSGCALNPFHSSASFSLWAGLAPMGLLAFRLRFSKRHS